jgi:predicted DNA-binding transcriptional regulator YafY
MSIGCFGQFKTIVMPVNKDALKRYRIIDAALADPNRDYTTNEILRMVNREVYPPVTLRMVQKDILAIEEEFGKPLLRNAGGKGTVRYKDQSSPVFSQELTSDEREVLCESLKTLEQFEGLENFASLDLLRRRLDLSVTGRPVISFSHSDILQIPSNLLGRLFTAISRRKVIRFLYTRFGHTPESETVYPYQLRQYNERWFLLATPVGTDADPYDGENIVNFALDRMSERFEYVDDIPYMDTPVDIEERLQEVVGVTLFQNVEVEQIYFAVKPASADYVRTKFIHHTQIEIPRLDAEKYLAGRPSLKGCGVFSIECRPNYELYSRFASFGANVIILEPKSMVEQMREWLSKAVENYRSFPVDNSLSR